MNISKVKQWLYENYWYQKSIAFLLNDEEMIKTLDEEYIVDCEKSDDLIIKEYNLYTKLEQIEKDFK